MSCLKKIYLNWFILGFTLGLIPYVLDLIIRNESITINSIFYLLFLIVPSASAIILRKIL